MKWRHNVVWGALVATTSGCATGGSQSASEARPVSEQPTDDAIAGDWSGVLEVGPQKLPLVFHVHSKGDRLTATMDSPAQNGFGLPVEKAAFDGKTLRLEMTAIGAAYRGTLSEDARELRGTFRQAGATFPLNLSRALASTSGLGTRPQDPVPPLPYREEEVRFDGAGFHLAGTLTLPEGAVPTAGFPAVALVTGSGPQNRDEEIFNHRPFRIVADHLTRAGVVVLRYDDRGVGGSGGAETLATATSREFAEDAAAALVYLAARDEVNPEAVGLLGHSEGGLIATLLASGRVAVDPEARPDFVIQLAGSAIRGAELLAAQSKALQSAASVPKSTIEATRRANERVYALALSGAPREETEAQVRETLQQLGMGEAQLAAQTDALYQPWFLAFLAYDPGPDLRQIRVPVLALFGALDLQVTSAENLAAMAEALEAAPTEDVTILEIPGANHLFQPAETGLPAEYAQIDVTLMPEVLAQLSGWIVERFGEAP